MGTAHPWLGCHASRVVDNLEKFHGTSFLRKSSSGNSSQKVGKCCSESAQSSSGIQKLAVYSASSSVDSASSSCLRTISCNSSCTHRVEFVHSASRTVSFKINITDAPFDSGSELGNAN